MSEALNPGFFVPGWNLLLKPDENRFPNSLDSEAVSRRIQTAAMKAAGRNGSFASL
jgi:hypothetical protein